ATILLYVVFNRENYTYYESSFLRDFWHAMQSAPFPHGITPFTKQLYDCFFAIPGPRFFIPDVLPIPLPYYWLLVPGFVLALWEKRFEIVLLAIIPVAGAFIARSIENRLLLPIPFWIILMSFTFAGISELRRWPAVQVVCGALSGFVLRVGVIPHVRSFIATTRSAR